MLFLEIGPLGLLVEEGGRLFSERAAPLVHLVRVDTIFLAEFVD